MKPMTAAQAAQQGNRDGAGRYAEKTHSDPGDVGLSEDESWNAIADIDGASHDDYLAALPQTGDRVWVHFDNTDLDEPDGEATVVEVRPDYGRAPEYVVRLDGFNRQGERKQFRVMPWELYPIPAARADRFSDQALAEAEAVFEEANLKPGVDWEEYDLAANRVTLIRVRRLAAIVHDHIPDVTYIRLVDANDENGDRNICFEDAARADGARRSCVAVYDQIRTEMCGIGSHNAEVWLPLCTSREWCGEWQLDIDKAMAISGADLDRGSIE